MGCGDGAPPMPVSGGGLSMLTLITWKMKMFKKKCKYFELVVVTRRARLHGYEVGENYINYHFISISNEVDEEKRNEK